MDHEALGRLIDRHARALALYARQWCEPADDVVQEAFAALASLRQPPDHPVAWLFRTVRHRAINAGKAARRRRLHESAAGLGWFAARAPRHHPDHLDPEDAAAALAKLPPNQREIIVAHLWGGLTFEEVAALARISTSSAHRLYHAGLTTLREQLGVPCPATPRSRSTPT
ncbi:MAG: hypothetical protein KatS3mg108_2420 [Isosphaeraceae bacterium]|nr:MAG: hypothetical protein KatS3mg108_2420 [Isosphaeraceae bacterium]